MGAQFLKHIERNNVLLFVLSVESDVYYEYEALLNELKAYRKDLLDKPKIIALSKMDIKEDFRLKKDLYLPKDIPVIPISSAISYGLDQLREVLWKGIQHVREQANKKTAKSATFTHANLNKSSSVKSKRKNGDKSLETQI